MLFSRFFKRLSIVLTRASSLLSLASSALRAAATGSTGAPLEFVLATKTSQISSPMHRHPTSGATMLTMATLASTPRRIRYIAIVDIIGRPGLRLFLRRLAGNPRPPIVIRLNKATSKFGGPEELRPAAI